MKEAFTKTYSGLYINNLRTEETVYKGYLERRRQQNPEFYNKRNEVLFKTFLYLLSPVVDFIEKEKPDHPIRVLDLGCGDGILLRSLYTSLTSRNMPCDLYGLDLDTEPMKNVITPKIQLTEASAEQIPYRDGVFDMITSTQTIEHMELGKIVQTFHEAYRVLRKGGLFYLETPNPESIESKIMGDEWPMYLPEHLTLISPRPLVIMLQKAGFQLLYAGTRVEVDEQVNELWEIATRVKIPGITLIPWRFKLGITGFITKLTDKGSVTIGLVRKVQA